MSDDYRTVTIHWKAHGEEATVNVHNYKWEDARNIIQMVKAAQNLLMDSGSKKDGDSDGR